MINTQTSWAFMIVHGWSMSPWLRSGDVVLVDTDISMESLRIGEVAVFRDEQSDTVVAHRVVGRKKKSSLFSVVIKGDRNSHPDEMNQGWSLQGVIRKRYRHGSWKTLRCGRLLGLVSSMGLYPGQVIPSWISRNHFTKQARDLCEKLFWFLRLSYGKHDRESKEAFLRGAPAGRSFYFQGLKRKKDTTATVNGF